MRVRVRVWVIDMHVQVIPRLQATTCKEVGAIACSIDRPTESAREGKEVGGWGFGVARTPGPSK